MEFKQELRNFLSDPRNFSETQIQLVLTSAIHMIGYAETIVILTHALGDTVYKHMKASPRDARERVFAIVKADMQKKIFRGMEDNVIPFPLDLKKPTK